MELETIELNKLIQREMEGFPGQYAVYLEDEKENKIEIQADEKWETASCIKIAILIELFRWVNLGEISLSDKIPFTEENHTMGSGIMRYLTPGMELSLHDLATLMIIISDNVATNILIDFLGMKNINSNCLNLGLEKTKLKEKIYFKPDTPTVIGETTCREYIQMFKLIKKEVYGPQATEDMLAILKNQKFSSMLTRFLPIGLLQSSTPGEKPEIEVGSKSGSLKNCRNDGGIVFTPRGDYYIAVFTKDFSDSYYHMDHISNCWAPRINKLVFQHFLARGGSL